jgi:hypothetical protein
MKNNHLKDTKEVFKKLWFSRIREEEIANQILRSTSTGNIVLGLVIVFNGLFQGYPGSTKYLIITLGFACASLGFLIRRVKTKVLVVSLIVLWSGIGIYSFLVPLFQGTEPSIEAGVLSSISLWTLVRSLQAIPLLKR